MPAIFGTGAAKGAQPVIVHVGTYGNIALDFVRPTRKEKETWVLGDKMVLRMTVKVPRKSGGYWESKLDCNPEDGSGALGLLMDSPADLATAIQTACAVWNGEAIERARTACGLKPTAPAVAAVPTASAEVTAFFQSLTAPATATIEAVATVAALQG